MSSTFGVKSSELTITTHKAQDIVCACGKQMTANAGWITCSWQVIMIVCTVLIFCVNQTRRHQITRGLLSVTTTNGVMSF
jgi:hypothetical protein